jgi:hypothetical protein
MSHFTSIKTNITEFDLLIKTLDNLEISWKKKNTITNFYNNESQQCEIVIKQPNNHEIGFVKIDSVYQLVYDESFWQQTLTINNFKNKLNTYYSLNLITKNLTKEGFEVIDKITQTNYGNVKIKLNALRYS